MMPREIKLLTWHDCHRLKTDIYWAYDEPYPQNREEIDTIFHWSAILVRHGKLEVRKNKGAEGFHVARQGDWCLIPPGTWDRKWSRTIRYMSVHFSIGWDEGTSFLKSEKPVILSSRDYPRLEQEGSRVVRFLRRQPHYKEGVHNAVSFAPWEYLDFQKLIAGWGRTVMDVARGLHLEFAWKLNLSESLRKALGFMEGSVSSRILSATEIARMAGVSRSHLDYLFHKETGCSFKEHYDRMRYGRALKLLASGKDSIKEISYQLHFKYPPKFCQWFRRVSGSTPLEFRKRFSGKGEVLFHGK